MLSITKQNTTNHITIDFFNKLTGQETLHPLITLVSYTDSKEISKLHAVCDLYGLIYGSRYIKFIRPGEVLDIPVSQEMISDKYTGVLFHPDLLCETTLEEYIDKFSLPYCYGVDLSVHDQQVISDCLNDIQKELQHSIDTHSSKILVSCIELLLNYCSRFSHNCRCNQ